MLNEIGVGVQLYTLRNECEKDFFKTLERVAGIGYEGVELAGLFGHRPEEVKERLDELGLEVVGHHIPFERIEQDLEQVIYEQMKLGNTRIVCPWLPPEMRNEESYERVADVLKDAVEKCVEHGMSISYHHHDFELEKKMTNSPLTMILDRDERIQGEFDIYWLERAGHNPVDWLKAYKGRTPVVHLKDRSDDGNEDTVILGTGNLAIQDVLEQGPESNVQWWVVEQDECQLDPIESISRSYRFLRKLEINKK
ncbi:sugar phosphate isomerase/epimerase family protein [Guptibacillus algicola]|uniref:sugar phosphate isomerase/epimerase family protein n=1 Tax=Guptibacillus algicola TaxID=225844 RepID=UPI001CD1FEB0|nr:sugar phosphate isomerase/epimerase [Alkalihalobacillus algicola]MCA0986628.1 sugar phosphate isomerase/epimerase [Alkalihalobacillus algicola]